MPSVTQTLERVRWFLDDWAEIMEGGYAGDDSDDAKEVLATAAEARALSLEILGMLMSIHNCGGIDAIPIPARWPPSGAPATPAARFIAGKAQSGSK